MKRNRTNRVALAGLLALAAGSATLSGFALAQEKPMPEMTVQIYNSSNNYNLYPVLEAGTAASADQWLQAFFEVPKAKLGTDTYRTTQIYRFFINPTGNGIPPRGNVTIKLPLATQIVENADPTKADQYINWWKGGRFYIYDAPASEGKPPAALTEKLDPKKRPSQHKVTPAGTYADVPTCVPPPPLCTKCPPCPAEPYQIYGDSAGQFLNNEPSQVTEHTLGAINAARDPIGLNTFNVDIDVSYVNNAYLPVAMGVLAKGKINNHVGYIGTPASIDTFRGTINKFLARDDYKGWPQYKYAKKVIPKLASPLEVYVQQSDTGLTPRKTWKPIDTMSDNWQSCVKAASKPKNKKLSARVKLLPAGFCDNISTFRTLYKANYDNYAALYASEPSCDKAKFPKPEALSEAKLRQHVYSWTPFNFGCTDAQFNLVENTPGYRKGKDYSKYQAVKARFDKMQLAKDGVFDPWVQIIKGYSFIGAKNAYAYSVDDALGNLQADGDGIILSVGGKDGLPSHPATTPINVAFGYDRNQAIRFTTYGACENPPDMDVNPDFASFIIAPSELGDDCMLSLQDNASPSRTYLFEIKKQPPYPPLPTDPKAPIPDANRCLIDCSANPAGSAERAWCVSYAYAYTRKSDDQNHDVHYFITGSAIQSPQPPNPPKCK